MAALKPASGAEIRRADHRDLERVVALWIDLTEHHAGIDPLFELRAGAEDEVRRLLEAQLRDPETAVFVREESGRLAGFFAMRRWTSFATGGGIVTSRAHGSGTGARTCLVRTSIEFWPS